MLYKRNSFSNKECTLRDTWDVHILYCHVLCEYCSLISVMMIDLYTLICIGCEEILHLVYVCCYLQSKGRSNKGVYDDMLARLTPISLRKYQFSKKHKNSAAT